MYNDTLVIDTHGHQSPPPEYKEYQAQLLRFRNFGGRRPFTMSDDTVRGVFARHLALIDERNIDVQLISPRPVDMWHWEVPAIQTEWCRLVNDFTAQICRIYPDRFVGVAQLPQDRLSDTSNCIDELERAIEELGFVAAIVNPDPGADGLTVGMAEDYWYPLYECAERLGVTLMIHGSISRDRRIQMVPHAYQVNNFVMQFYASLALEHGNVFRDFPNLKVVICHFGGFLNRFLHDDPEHVYGNRYLPDNLAFDSCAYDPDYVALGIKQKRHDRVVFGVECPGSGGQWSDAAGRVGDNLVPVIASMDSIDEEAKKDIFFRNALRFYPRLEDRLKQVGRL